MGLNTVQGFKAGFGIACGWLIAHELGDFINVMWYAIQYPGR